VYAERGVSRAMGGSCSMPLAAHAILTQNTLSIRAAWGDHLQEGSRLIYAEHQSVIDPKDLNILQTASTMGELVAQKLIDQGARPSFVVN